MIGTDPKAIIGHYEELLGLARQDHNLELEKSILDSLSRINAMFTDRIKQENTNKFEASASIRRIDQHNPVVIKS
jgi:hypothetical protein